MKKQIELNVDRDFSGVFNVLIDFLKQEYKLLFKTLILFASLPLIVLAIFNTIYFNGMTQSLTSIFAHRTPGAAPNDVPVMMYLYVFTFICYFMITGLSFSYLNLYNEKGSGNFTHLDVWYRFVSRIGKMIGFQLIAVVLMIFGFILLIIPGIYVMIPLVFIMMVALVENKGIGDSLSRCFDIIKNNWWVTFGLVIVVGIIVNILSSVFSLPSAAYIMVSAFFGASSNSQESGLILPGLFSLIAVFGSYLLSSVSALLIGIQYYNLVEKKDKLSLFNKVDKLGESNE